MTMELEWTQQRVTSWGKRQWSTEVEALGREVDLVTDIVKNPSRATYGRFIIDSLKIVHPLLSAPGVGSPATLPVACH